MGEPELVIYDKVDRLVRQLPAPLPSSLLSSVTCDLIWVYGRGNPVHYYTINSSDVITSVGLPPSYSPWLSSYCGPTSAL